MTSDLSRAPDTFRPQQDDLDAALRGGVIGGAAIDVYEIEPLPADHPIWDAPNFLMTVRAPSHHHNRARRWVSFRTALLLGTKSLSVSSRQLDI